MLRALLNCASHQNPPRRPALTRETRPPRGAPVRARDAREPASRALSRPRSPSESRRAACGRSWLSWWATPAEGVVAPEDVFAALGTQFPGLQDQPRKFLVVPAPPPKSHPRDAPNSGGGFVGLAVEQIQQRHAHPVGQAVERFLEVIFTFGRTHGDEDKTDPPARPSVVGRKTPDGPKWLMRR